jgi:hypothetical protein
MSPVRHQPQAAASRMPRAAAAMIALPLLAAGCGGTVGMTFEPGAEAQPGPGVAHLAGDPAEAPGPLVISFVTASGDPFDPVTDKVFARRQTIEGETFSLPGTYGVLVNGAACEGEFTLVSNRRTNLVLHLSGDQCRVEVVSIERI